MSLQQQIRERAKALTSLLSIQYPIIAAPMMGVTTPAMVAAVSNAGGLGSLPCGVMTGDAITKAIADVRALTDKPFAVNLRVPPRQEPTPEATQTIFDALEPLRDELGAKHELVTIPSFEEQFEAVLASDVPVVSFSFGGPREVFAEALEAKGTIMMGSVNSFEFHRCRRTPQVGYLTLSLRLANLIRPRRQVSIVYCADYQGI